jgi:hypothetical protein
MLAPALSSDEPSVGCVPGSMALGNKGLKSEPFRNFWEGAGEVGEKLS